MSIWCSWPTIGHDPFDPDGEHREPDDPTGDVRAYVDGWSNHYPLYEFGDKLAGLDLAHIPAWCVPGHDDYTEFEAIGPWLRIMVDSWEHRWHDPRNLDATVREQASIVMDEAAVRSLRDQLTRWLDRPKVQPVTDDSFPQAATNGGAS